MTLSPVISGAPAQATPRNRPSQGSDDQSKDFYSYLRSSTHDEDEAPGSNIGERTTKTGKNEKQTDKKADEDQVTDAIAAPVTPQIEQPAPPLPITALLGLPTVQKTDAAETGKATNNDGKAVLSLANIGSNTGSDPQPAAKFDSPDATPLILTHIEPRIDAQPKIDGSQPSQKDRHKSADAKVDPAALWSAIAPQLLDIAPPKEDSKLDPVSSAGATTGNEINGSPVELLTAGTSPSETTSAPSPGNLAFALRLSEGPLNSKLQQHSPQAPSAEPITGAVQSGNTDLATAVAALAESQLKEQSHEHDNGTGTAFYEVPQTHPRNIPDAPQLANEQPAHITAADLEAKQEIANAEPVRNVHMQVIGDNNNRVDVRLTDRGGELHVSVKSGDMNLAQNLQDHMPELTSRLEQQRFQTEVWIPKLADNGKAEMSGTRDFSSNGNNNSNNSSNNSDRQGKGQQQYKPDWVDVLENSTRGAGKSEQTWLQ